MQDTRMCWADSSSWSQRRQTLGYGNPCFSKRSAVQTLFLIASHMKNLHRRGAQVLQVFLQGSIVTVPKKKGVISRFTRILSWTCELPKVMIRKGWLQGKTFHQHPKLQVFDNHLDCEGFLDVSDPTPVRAWETARCLLALLGINWKRLGSSSPTELPCSHRSVQNLVSTPFPTFVCTTTWKRARAL